MNKIPSNPFEFLIVAQSSASNVSFPIENSVESRVIFFSKWQSFQDFSSTQAS